MNENPDCRAEAARLKQNCRPSSSAKAAKIAVLMTGTTFPDPIESYSIPRRRRLEDRPQGVSDGILVVVAKIGPSMRLEVGYGLEGAIPDAMARRLIDEVFIPGSAMAILRRAERGHRRLVKWIDGEPHAEVSQSASRSWESAFDRTYFVLFIVATLAFAACCAGLLGRPSAALVVGAGIGFLAWLIVAPAVSARWSALSHFCDAVRRQACQARRARWIWRREAWWAVRVFRERRRVVAAVRRDAVSMSLPAPASSSDVAALASAALVSAARCAYRTGNFEIRNEAWRADSFLGRTCWTWLCFWRVVARERALDVVFQR